jgi:hypothetical protein
MCDLSEQVGLTERTDGPPSEHFLDDGAHVGAVGPISESGHAVAAHDGVDLCLGFAHHVGVEGHGEHEHRECGGCLRAGSGKARKDGAGE